MRRRRPQSPGKSLTKRAESRRGKATTADMLVRAASRYDIRSAASRAPSVESAASSFIGCMRFGCGGLFVKVNRGCCRGTGRFQRSEAGLSVAGSDRPRTSGCFTAKSIGPGAKSATASACDCGIGPLCRSGVHSLLDHFKDSEDWLATKPPDCIDATGRAKASKASDDLPTYRVTMANSFQTLPRLRTSMR